MRSGYRSAVPIIDGAKTKFCPKASTAQTNLLVFAFALKPVRRY